MSCYHINIRVDLPVGTDELTSEGIVAHAIAQALIKVGTPGNVMATLVKVEDQTSVANYSPYCAPAQVIDSPGSTTWPGANHGGLGRASQIVQVELVPPINPRVFD